MKEHGSENGTPSPGFAAATEPGPANGRAMRERIRDSLVARIRARSDRLFHDLDEKARQHGWTMETGPFGLSRSYRNPRFDSLPGPDPSRRQPMPHRSRTPLSPGSRQVPAMINLLILVGAVLIASRLMRPLLRVAIALLVSVLGAILVVALAIILLVGVLTHGMLI